MPTLQILQMHTLTFECTGNVEYGVLQDKNAQSENMQLLFNCIPTKPDTSAFDTERSQGINVSNYLARRLIKGSSSCRNTDSHCNPVNHCLDLQPAASCL